MAKTSLQIRLVATVSAALLCACCSGCITVPVRVPTKTIGVSGVTGKKLDLTFIKAGATTREEIVQKLGWVDTGVRDDLFVGRWAESSWGVAWAVAGGYRSAGGWNRAWTIHNLVVELNDKGVVLQSLLLPDKDILRTLSDWISKDPIRSLDLSVPIRAPIEYIRSGKNSLGTLILSKDDFRFLEDRETGSKVVYDFKTPPENVRGLSLGHWVASNSSHPENITVTIHFKRKTAVGSKLVARVDLPTAMILLKYIRQTRSDSSFK